jgi:hypothetical protein
VWKGLRLRGLDEGNDLRCGLYEYLLCEAKKTLALLIKKKKKKKERRKEGEGGKKRKKKKKKKQRKGGKWGEKGKIPILVT